jgi:hypothetical protein
VVLAYERDAVQVNSGAKNRLLEIQDSISGTVWTPFSLSVKPDDRTILIGYGNTILVQTLYTDIYKYSIGQVLVATFGVPTGLLGELWIDYEVELMEPAIDIPPTIMARFTGTAFASGTLWPALANVTSSGNIAPAIGTAGNTLKLNLPPCALFVYLHTLSSAALGAVSLTSSTGVVLNSGYTGSSSDAACWATISYTTSTASGNYLDIIFTLTNSTLSGTFYMYITPYDCLEYTA